MNPEMESAESESPLSLTVRIPFSSDLTVSAPSSMTVERLLDMVRSMLPPPTPTQRPTPEQCIVHAGRVLSDSDTLAHQRVTDGAVLHLMRRPSPSPPTPSSDHDHHHHHHLPVHVHHVIHRADFHVHGSGNNHGRSDSEPDSNHNHDHSHDNHDHHDHHEHHHHEHHHHDHHHGRPQGPTNRDGETQDNNNGGASENHVHANLFIGHLAADGHIGFRDAHDVLSSVLQAVGFSPRAVATAATTAAAVAVVNHGPTSRTSRSPSLPRIAFDAITAARSADPSTPSAARERPENASDTIVPALASLLRDVATHLDSYASSRASLSAANVRGRPGHSANHSDDADESIEISADASHGASQNDTVVNEPNPSVSGVMTRLSSTAHAISSTLAFLSTHLASDYNADGSRRSQPSSSPAESEPPSAPSEDPTGRGSADPGIEQSSSADAAARNDVSNNSQPQEAPRSDGARQAPIRSVMNGIFNMFYGQQGAPRMSADISQAFAGGLDHHQGHGDTEIVDEADESDNDESENEEGQNNADERSSSAPSNSEAGNIAPGGSPQSSSSRRGLARTRNADFMVRFLSYYVCSLVDVGGEHRPEGPTNDDCDAATALNDMYDCEGRALAPAHRLLNIVYQVLQKLSPSDVHKILGGDLLPLAPLRSVIWGLILKEMPPKGDGSEADVGGENGDDDDFDLWFTDTICNSVHEFIHDVERIASGTRSNEEDDDRNDFCHDVMNHVLEFPAQLEEIMTSDDLNDERFAGKLKELLQKSVGIVLACLASELSASWDELLPIVRDASAKLSRDMFGPRFSVLLPFLLNLFSGRIKHFYEIEMSNLSNNSASHSTTDDPIVIDVTLEVEEDQDITESNSLSPNPPSIAPTPSNEVTSRSPPAVNSAMDSNPVDAMDDISLDDDEMADLAMELDAEMINANDTKVEGQVPKNESIVPESKNAPFASSSVTTTPSTSLHGASLAPVFGTRSQSRVGLGIAAAPSLSNGGVGTGATRGKASFSSTAAVPRPIAPHKRDEFDAALPANEAAVWRKVVERDGSRVSDSPNTPLSRAYRSERSMVAPLDEHRASSMAAESAHAAATAARLPEDAARQLSLVAEQSGTEYLREVENAIATRLTSDPDFDPTRFTEANNRFLKQRAR